VWQDKLSRTPLVGDGVFIGNLISEHEFFDKFEIRHVRLQEVTLMRPTNIGECNKKIGLTLCYRSFTDNPLDADVFIAKVVLE
jgi:hypothetical protein